METVTIRDADVKDAERMLEIYAYYVKNTAITFEYEVPTLDEFQKRIENTLTRYPYLVIEKDGVIQGYAYAGPFIGRAAYDWSCEMTIYLDHTSQKCGLGRKIYEALEDKLREMGILNLYACIGYPEHEDEYLNKNSADFHAHLGFRQVGEFHKCGYKFGRWYHMIWTEKVIGEHCAEPRLVMPGKTVLDDRNCIRKAAVRDASRLAEILVFTKRMNYRSIFHNDKVSFGEIQVLPLAQEYIERKEKLESIWVYDDEFVKGMLHVEDGWIHELYVDSFFQNKGIGGRLIDFAIESLHARNLMVLEKNDAAIRFYRAHGFSMTEERRLEEGTEEFVIKMER